MEEKIVLSKHEKFLILLNLTSSMITQVEIDMSNKSSALRRLRIAEKSLKEAILLIEERCQNIK